MFKDHKMFYFWKLVRYGMAAAGGVMLKEGYVDGVQLEMLLGAASTVLSIGASVYQSRARAERLGVTKSEYTTGY